MKISLGIITWNSFSAVELLLARLAIFQNDQRYQLEVIVVDNGDNSDFSLLEGKYPVVQFLHNPVNRGFSFACNQVLMRSSGTWLGFLNPDIEISIKAIHRLIEKAEEQQLDAFSPDDPSPNYQKPIPSVGSLLWEFTFLHRIHVLKRLFPSRTLLGGCLFIKRSVLLDLSGWDERFFLWFEDSDLTKRLASARYKLGIIQSREFKHIGGTTFSTLNDTYKKALFFGALRSYIKKHFSFFSCGLLQYVIHRFSDNKLLPEDACIRASFVIPNMRLDVLNTFLEKNSPYMDCVLDEWIVVTSQSDFFELKKKFPYIIFIYNKQNKGFAQMVNTGLKRARGKYIGTVNDDTIFQKGWIDALVSKFTKNVATVSPIVLRLNGEVESCGINVLAHGKAVRCTAPNGNSSQSNAFNAAAVLCQREALNSVGLFDEKFGSYLEDLDLGLRFSRSGYQNLCANDSHITHVGQQTSNQFSRYRAWLNVKNWWLLMMKNYSLSHWLRFGPKILMERARNLSGLIKTFTHA